MSVILNTPPEVRQTTTNSCWAASFISWSRAVGIPNPPEAELFRGLQSLLNSDGSATESAIRSISHVGFMTVRKVRGVSLTPNFLETTLRQFGHIYMAYRPAADGGASGHVVVIYGVNDSNQALVMDPDPATVLPCHTPIDWYGRRTSAIVCTSILGSGVVNNPFRS